MSTQLAESVGAKAYAEHEAAQPGSMAFAAEQMRCFQATAIVDQSGVSGGDALDRLNRAIDNFAPPHLPFRERFEFALREITAAQLGEQRAHQWHDLKLSRRAQELYWHFRKSLIAEHPELLDREAGQ